MSRGGRSVGGHAEQQIAALIPDVRAGKVVAPAGLPDLPPTPTPADAVARLLDVACLDRSGRFSARSLLAALRWEPGQRLTIDAVRGLVLVQASSTGPAAVGPRGLIALPAAARRLCGLTARSPVVLIASADPARLVVHPAQRVARLIADLTAHLLAGDDDGC